MPLTWKKAALSQNGMGRLIAVAFVAAVVVLLFGVVVLFVLVFVLDDDDYDYDCDYCDFVFENTCTLPTCAWHTSPYLPVYFNFNPK